MVDPTGLPNEDVLDAKGNKVGTVITEKVNCLGYATRQRGSMSPNWEADTPLGTLLSALGYECHEGVSAINCQAKCKCEDYIEVYVYIDKEYKDDYESIKKKYAGKSILKDPIVNIGPYNELDFHGLRGEANGSYTFQSVRSPRNDPDNKTELPVADRPTFKPTADQPDFFGEHRLIGMACCCNKKVVRKR